MEEEKSFIIIGGGGHARVVASTLRQLEEDIEGFTDPQANPSLNGDIEYLGTDAVLDKYPAANVALTVGVGSARDTTLRTQLFCDLKSEEYYFPPIVHPSAFVASEVFIEAGAQIMAGVVIQPGATISENVIVNTNASIDHDCEIGAHTHVAPGVTLSGEVSTGDRVHIGTGASLIQGIHVGTRSVVGAGAVVIDDVPPETVVVGVPAAQKYESSD